MPPEADAAVAPGRRAGWLVALGVGALAALPRLWNLGYPHDLLFDETYYAKDAWSLLQHGYVQKYVAGADEQILAGNHTDLFTGLPATVAHPEVGKWLIAAGEWVGGFTPEGWRLAPAVVGVAMVVVLVRLALRLTGSLWLAGAAGAFLALDGMHLVLSRLALLDIFVAFFVVCAVHCLVADRDWFRERLSEGGLDSLAWRPWLLASGVCWGLALGTKWSALWLLAAFGILVWLWSARSRADRGLAQARVKSLALDALPATGWLVIVGLLVYVGTWAGWLANAGEYEEHLADQSWTHDWGEYIEADASGFPAEAVQSLRSLWHYHRDIYTFHTSQLNDADHPYESHPLGWLTLNKTVGVDAQRDIPPGVDGCEAAEGETCLRVITMVGNPAVWWLGCAALAWGIWRRFGAGDRRWDVPLIGVAAGWLPWLLYTDRPIFAYYAIVALPFLVLGLALALDDVIGSTEATSRRKQIGWAAAGLVTVAVVASFVWFWPIWTDGMLTHDEWLQRMWRNGWI